MSAQHRELGRPSGQPLQVYLDSSDFSVLGDAMEKPGHLHAGTLKKLIDLVDAGQIEVRYSGISVVEVSHLEKDAKDAGVRRARCIERLSKGRCFSFWTTLLAREQENFANQRPLYEGLTSEDGFWFPDIGDLARTFRSDLENSIRGMIKENVNNRRQRRELEKKLLKDGKLTPFAVEKLLVPRRGELLKTFAEQFPLSDRFFKEDFLIRYATGQVSSSEMLYELSIVFRDVEKFVGWTYDVRDTERKTIKWLRDLGARFRSDITNMRKLFEPLIGNYPAEWIKNSLDAMVAERLPVMRRDFITKMAERPANAPIGELGSLPALDAFVSAIGAFVKMSIRGNRKLLDSDSGDLFHLAHAPYCDVFRADGNTSQIANQVLKPYGTKVVPKLADLIGVLERALHTRTEASPS
jgi:hypothetical protein